MGNVKYRIEPPIKTKFRGIVQKSWEELMCFLTVCVFLITLLSPNSSMAFSDSTFIKRNRLATPSELDKKRLGGYLGVSGGIFTGAMIGLSVIWYKDFPKSKFHFFN